MTGEGTAPAAAARLAERRLRRRSDVHEVRLDAELVLYDARTGSLHQLDPIAAMIWGLLDGTGALGDWLPTMAARFGVDVEIVASDVMRLVEELDGLGLLATS